MRLSLIRLLPRVRTHHQIHDDTHAAIACDMLNPAQCPEHALMARIPLGLGPSLHQLRSRSLCLVRRLHHSRSLLRYLEGEGKTRAEARVLTGLYSSLTCEPADFAWLFSFVVLIRDPTLPWERRPHCPTFGGIFGLDCANPWEACLACREYASGAVPFPARLSIDEIVVPSGRSDQARR